MRIAARAQRIEPFYVMEVAKAAQALAHAVQDGPEPMIFLNIGEPDFTAPPLVQEAAARTIASGGTQYTQALGLPALRERISGWYAERFGVDVPARRIVVTAGASAASKCCPPPWPSSKPATKCSCRTPATPATAIS